jgi:hypothetical protein
LQRDFSELPRPLAGISFRLKNNERSLNLVAKDMMDMEVWTTALEQLTSRAKAGDNLSLLTELLVQLPASLIEGCSHSAEDIVKIIENTHGKGLVSMQFYFPYAENNLINTREMVQNEVCASRENENGNYIMMIMILIYR